MAYQDYINCSREELLEKMAELLPEKRLTHCLGVERAAIELAQRFGVDVEKAGLAGLLHDYAKKLSDQEFLDLIDRYQLDSDLKNWGNNVWHGMVGIYKIQEDLDLQDSEILRAIETIELERKGISYTYDTMKLLTEKNPDTDYYFIIGADMVDYLPKWYRIDELVDLVQFVGVQRPRYKAGTSYPVIWVDVPLMDISSSMVRDFIAQGRTPNFLLPKPVLDYIEKEGLY